MRKITVLYLHKKRTSILHQIKKRHFPLQKMMAVDVPVDQLFLKFIIALFLFILPYTGVLMFLYFAK